MTALIIDTSRENALIALSKKGEVLLSETLVHGNQLSETLLPAIKKLFETGHLLPKHLDYIGIGIGPGSYTGTRVGAAVGKALSFALQIPLISFCSLLAHLPEKRGSYASIIEGKGGDFYLLKGQKNQKKITCHRPPNMLPLEALAAALEGVEWIATPEPLSFQSLLRPLAEPGAWQWVGFTPNPQPPADYCYEKFESGEHPPSEIIYLYNYPPLS